MTVDEILESHKDFGDNLEKLAKSAEKIRHSIDDLKSAAEKGESETSVFSRWTVSQEKRHRAASKTSADILNVLKRMREDGAGSYNQLDLTRKRMEKSVSEGELDIGVGKAFSRIMDQAGKGLVDHAFAKDAFHEIVTLNKNLIEAGNIENAELWWDARQQIRKSIDEVVDDVHRRALYNQTRKFTTPISSRLDPQTAALIKEIGSGVSGGLDKSAPLLEAFQLTDVVSLIKGAVSNTQSFLSWSDRVFDKALAPKRVGNGEEDGSIGEEVREGFSAVWKSEATDALAESFGASDIKKSASMSTDFLKNTVSTLTRIKEILRDHYNYDKRNDARDREKDSANLILGVRNAPGKGGKSPVLKGGGGFFEWLGKTLIFRKILTLIMSIPRLLGLTKLGKLFSTFGALFKSFRGFGRVLAKLGPQLGALFKSFRGFGRVLAKLGPQLGAFFFKSFRGFGRVLAKLGPQLGAFFFKSFRGFGRVLAKLGPQFGALFKSFRGFRGVLAKLGPQFGGVLAKLGPQFGALFKSFRGFRGVLAKLGPQFGGVLAKLGPQFGALFKSFRGFRGVLAKLGPQFGTLFKSFRGFGGVLARFAPVLFRLTGPIAFLIGTALDLVSIIRKPVEYFQKFDEAIDEVQAYGKKAGHFFGVMASIWEAMKRPVGSILKFASSIYEAIKSVRGLFRSKGRLKKVLEESEEDAVGMIDSSAVIGPDGGTSRNIGGGPRVAPAPTTQVTVQERTPPPPRVGPISPEAENGKTLEKIQRALEQSVTPPSMSVPPPITSAGATLVPEEMDFGIMALNKGLLFG